MLGKLNNNKDFDSENLIIFIYNWKKPLLIISAIAFMISVIISLTITPMYKSTVIMFPTATNSISKALISKTNVLKQDVLQFGEDEEAEQMLQILNSSSIREKIIEKYNLVHLSTGDLLRKELETNSRLGQIAKRHMNKGGLVPDDIILGMVSKEIEANKGTSGVVLDGFPRTVDQAKGLDRLLANKHYDITAMFALDVHEDELVRRLLDRAKIGGRVDDTPDIIEKRIQTYKLTTA